MKEFFKTILYGIYGLVFSALSILNFAYAVICFTYIADNEGFIAVLFFVLGIVCLALGVFILWLIGLLLREGILKDDNKTSNNEVD